MPQVFRAASESVELFYNSNETIIFTI